MKLKMWTALALCLVMMFGLTGCVGNLYENVGTIDGTEINAGLYLMAQYSAYSDAKNIETDSTQEDVLKRKIEGQSASKWIQEHTEQSLREYVLVRRLCREKGITIDSTGQENVQQMTQYWSYLEESYAANGIAYNSFERYLITQELKRQLMANMYSEGGELYVSDEQLMKEYGEQYAHMRAISVPISSTAEGVDVHEEIIAMAEKQVEKLEAGQTLEEFAEDDLAGYYEVLQRDFDPTTAVDSIFDSYTAYEQPNYETYTEQFLGHLKSQKVGDYGYYRMSSTVIIYEIIPTFEDQEAFDGMRSTVLSNLKSDAFDEHLASIYNEYTVNWGLGARFYYRPSKIEA